MLIASHSYGEFLLVINPPKPDKDIDGVVQQVLNDNLAPEAENKAEDEVKDEEQKTVQFVDETKQNNANEDEEKDAIE